jgi:hypothetical protein
MADKIFYPWERLWVPGSGTTVDEALTHDGYFYPNADTKPLEHWQDVACLILLGEPGMGKSAEWRRQSEQVVDGASQFVNLGDFSSGWDVVTALEKYPSVEKWFREPGSKLFLWLDSFDEALTHESKLAQALKRMLDRWPLAGLRIRILSRTATWPAFFTDDLKQRFDSPECEGNVVLLQLAPLTLSQLFTAAEHERIDPRAFVEAIEGAEAVPLAIRPVTFGLLIKLWKAGKFGPGLGRRTELLEAGCKLLCEEEWDTQRTPSPLHDPDRRLRVAAHLALVMVGSNRRILLYSETEDAELGLRLSEVTGDSTLPSDKPSIFLERNVVKDVLERTGLFAPSATRVIWAHQAYAEFLAAWALHKAQVPVPQLRNLFRSAVQGAGIVPGLRDTAVWLASLSAEFAAALLQLDPLTAMRADLLTASNTQRVELVNHLFALTREKHLYPRRAEPYLGRLAHPGLAGQLSHVLENADETPEAGWLAYKIAEGCSVRELVPLLIGQTLDTALPIRTRTAAIRVLRKLDDPATGQGLRPLITAMPADDEGHEFRGTLLYILWPGHLTVEELLLLIVHKDTRYFGAYQSFWDPAYSRGLADGINEGHLPRLLYWLIDHGRRADNNYPHASEDIFKALCHTAISIAWEHTDNPRVVAWLAAALSQLWVNYEAPRPPQAATPRNKVFVRMVKRHLLASPVSYRITDKINTGPSLGNAQASPQSLVDLHDWPLVLKLMWSCSHLETKRELFGIADTLLWQLLSDDDSRFQSFFLELYESVTSITWPGESPQAKWEFNLDSKAGEAQRKNWDRTQVYKRKQKADARKKRWLHRRTLYLLGRYSDETRNRVFHDWKWVSWLMNRSSNAGDAKSSLESNEEFRWLRYSQGLAQRIVKLAQRVVLEAPPAINSHPRLDTFYQIDSVYLAALLLCNRESPQYVSALTAEAWTPWVHLMLYAGWVAEGQRAELLGVALHHHRKDVVRQVLRSKELWQQLWAQEHGNYQLVELLKDVPDDIIKRAVLFSITAGRLPFDGALAVLKQLLSWRFRPAELFRNELLMQNPKGPALHRLTYVVFRASLFEAEDENTWWTMWQQVIRFGPEMVKQLIGSVEGRPSWEGPVPLHLTDAQLAELLTWLVESLGVKEENEDNDWRTESQATRVRNFRNTAAKRLAGRATAEAWEALNRLAIQHNYPRWLTYTLEEAAETYSRAEWEPMAPAQLIRYLRHAANRWIQSGEDLLDAIIESLDRLQQNMQGEPALADRFWYPANGLTDDRVRNGNKVVDENKVTDFVQFFLNKDLHQYVFSVKREVQLRDTSGFQKGQDLDLYIDAVAMDALGNPMPANKISVFVEAKHNDNREVTSALNGQLVNRYLRGHPTKYGLFLVYWHTKETGRSISRGSLAKLREELARQAQAASINGLLVKSYILDIRLPDDQ